MRLFLKLVALELASTLLIVACTRAYVKASYPWTALAEFLWLSQWFLMQKLLIENKESRSWLGFWAMQIGTIAGAMLGIWVSQHTLGS